MGLNTSVSVPSGTFIRDDPWEFFREKIGDFIQFLMFSSLFVGISGGGMVYVAASIQGLHCNPACIAIMVLIGFSVYNLNRKTDEAEDAINRKDRYNFTKKYEKHLYTAALAGYGLAILLAGIYGLIPLAVVLIPLLSGILYSIPCLPASTGYHRLKEIPVVKNLVVGIAWGTTLTFLPLAIAKVSFSSTTAMTLVFFSTYAFIASILPDIRDKEGDEEAGIRTIPAVIGIEPTLHLVTGLNIIIGCAATLFALKYLSPAVALIIGISVVYLHLCIHSFTRVEKKEIICDILTDGQFLFIGICAYFGGILLTGLISLPV